MDAHDPGSRLDVFGMSLVERLLRAVVESGAKIEVVAIAHGNRPRPAIESRFSATLPLVSVGGSGDDAKPAADDTLRWLWLDGQTLIDPRLIAHLLAQSGPVIARGDDGAWIALASQPEAGTPLGDQVSSREARGELSEISRSDIPSYLPKLRRHLVPYCMRLADTAARDRAEHTLFWSNYKGSTDFFTARVYPPLVWRMVRPLARYRVHPNWISLFNVLITLAAIPLFAIGAWVPGLLLAYTMSVLDSVDGKLARLTFRSSKIGHVLDHGLDVVHPPFWYSAWAYALDGGVTGPLFDLSLILFAAYFLDRIVTELFTRTTKRSIHAFAPIDVALRTWISRRNINVPIFTVGLLVGAPVAAFYIIFAWQILTLLFHAVRLAQVNLGGGATAGPLAP